MDQLDTSVAAPADRSSDSGHDDVLDLLRFVDSAVDRLRVLGGDSESDGDGDGDATPTAGSSAAAQENRTIHHARSRLARRDAEALGGELAAIRERVRLAVDDAGRAATASEDGRRRRRRAPEESASPGGEPPHMTVLVEAMDRAARRLLAHRSQERPEGVQRTLELIVAGAIEAIPHVERAGISMLDRDRTVRSHAPSDTVVAELDALQNTLHEGPCRDAVFDEPHVVVDDLADADTRWPRFAPAARTRGVATMLSLQLFTTDDGTAGALNLYAGEPGVFDPTSVETAALFASHAALALHGARRTTDLSVALQSRDVIGQAKGILIERFGLTEDQAFALLVDSSQTTNLKLRDVAEWTVTETVKKHHPSAG